MNSYYANSRRYSEMIYRPCGRSGLRKYMLASLDQSLRRMGLDYVDLFYSHRFDDFSADELAAIEVHAQEGGVNLWERPAQDLRP